MGSLDRIAEAYAGDLGESIRKDSRARIDWICELVRGNRVLDVGCSQGICELLLARRGFQVLGIDVAQESIDYSRELISREPDEVRSRVRLECRDFLVGPIQEECFDTVLLTEILEHLAEPEELVQRAAAQLSPGGRMIVTVPFGINDHPDHKQTFYLADILDLLSRHVSVQRVVFLGNWVGLCCEKTPSPEPLEQVASELVLREERAFFALERPLRDRLKKTEDLRRKAVSDYETAKGWVRARDERLAGMERKLEDCRQQLEQNLTEKAFCIGQLEQHLEARLAETDARLEQVRRDFETERQQTRRLLADKEASIRSLEGLLRKEQTAREALKTVSEKDRKAAQSEIAGLRSERSRLARQYKLLAESKLGRFTLWYWKRKDALLHQFRRGDPNEKTIRNAAKRIPGLRPLVLWLRTLRPEQKAPAAPLSKTGEVTPVQRKPQSELPGITVVIPTYRPTDYLAPCVDSVLGQDYPADKVEILLSVNGKDKAYADALTKRYAGEARIRVVYTPVAGASAGRNYARQFLNTEYVTYLDDDDSFTPGYLRELGSHTGVDISIVCGRLIDLLEDGTVEEATYINRAMESVGEVVTTDYLKLGSLFSTICSKLYRTQMVKEVWDGLDETLKHTEDVIFWVDNIDKPMEQIAVASPKSREAYVRRKLSNSRSRPGPEKEFDFNITDRLSLVERCANALLQAERPLMYKRFVLNKIDAMVQTMLSYYRSCTPELQDRAWQLIKASDCLFLNKALFAGKKAIAFCHNFAPAVDASAFVASKRLRQLGNYLGEPLAWKVVHADMSNVRSDDQYWNVFFARYQYAQCVTLPGPANFNEKAQEAWGRRAFETVRDESVPYIYSRSMWAGSHVAARLYKQAHPETFWIAEFSDPLYMDTENRPRPASRAYTGEDSHLNSFWKDLETAVFREADRVIFTNDNQRRYMLEHNPPENPAGVEAKCLVWPHPRIDERYANIVPTDYALAKESIHIGYFGGFYANRTAEPILMFLENPAVQIHIFTKVSKEQEEQLRGISPRLHLHALVPHLEVFAIARQMDYLFLNDISFQGEYTPYLPSKLADYLSVGTPVLGLVYPNTPMEAMEEKKLIKFYEGDTSVIQSLKKKTTA